MKQEKLCLYISRYDISEEIIRTLNTFGISDIQPINIGKKGAMRALFSHDQKDVVVVYGELITDDIIRVLQHEEYKIVHYRTIRNLVSETRNIQKIFENTNESEESVD